jgi:transitional endoplasmic reticulum ATPase
MARRTTKGIKYVRLNEHRIQEIQNLVALWPYETCAFMRARLNQYRPPSELKRILVDGFLSLFMFTDQNHFEILKDPEILTDWQRRFDASGERNPQNAWKKILEKEVSSRDYLFMRSLLEKELSDIHVPSELKTLFEKVYRAHIRKEYISDPEVPKSPLILVVGPSGSGKTATVTQTINKVIFADKVLPEVDLKQKKERVMAGTPFWKTVEETDPALAMEIYNRKRLRFYKTLSRIPVINLILKKRIGRNLSELEEQGIEIDYSVITPNDYQTALSGEPGNFFRKAMGVTWRTSIRHIEEAHSAFGRADTIETGSDRQQRTLIDTANIIIDEISDGRRDCLLIATTDQPERIDASIYRRFVEKGKIIDLSQYWKNPENLAQVVRLELKRSNIHIKSAPIPTGSSAITPENLKTCVSQIYDIFDERTLKITPSYVRKLLSSIIEIKKGFMPEYLEDAQLIRKAFELVAKNTYGDLYKKVVDCMDRQVKWDTYVGGVKDAFSEMANNCLQYGVSEEKGAVLYGPPGSGKTFLVRAWLSENEDIHDISSNASALQNSVSPMDGAVQNLEKIYDIGKMIAPTVMFFDEGDALAPRRSASGGSPSDKLTNKFLSLIDGEVPLRRVFTALTTNRIDILDPALIRSKRLQVIDVSGHLKPENIESIMQQAFAGVPLGPGIDIKEIVKNATDTSNTPADYAAFAEKVRSLRETEFEVIKRFRALADSEPELKEKFVRFNFKVLTGILEAIDAPAEIRKTAKNNPDAFVALYDQVLELLEPISESEDYPLVLSHLHSSRLEISRSPTKKGKVQLDEFLEAELSQEPQVGFIIGVGANDVAGVLLPIATSLNYNISYEKVLVTGAVSSSSPAAAELDMSVKMTRQSAQEALTLVMNYLKQLQPKISIPRLFGEFLAQYTIHHQLLSASYNVGGPSAGYALALNTLSALLQIPIYHDFGITGAPWTKGVKKGEVGGSVIIGGHKKKAEKVLLYLRRMYMPLQNYRDLELEFLESYWAKGKDILGVTHFAELVPEVVWLGAEYEKDLLLLNEMRVHYKKEKYSNGNYPQTDTKTTILQCKARLKSQLEGEISRRIEALRDYLRDPKSDKHLSLEEIYRMHQIAAAQLPS